VIIADTGFWVALLFRRDRFHPVAAAAYGRFRGSLITTWPILTQACYLLGIRSTSLKEKRGRYPFWETVEKG